MPLPHQNPSDEPELQWLERLMGDLIGTLFRIATAIIGILFEIVMIPFKK